MKRSFVFLIPLALGVFGVTSGCSSDEGSDAPSSVDREILPKKLAEAFCENVTDCCTDARVEQEMDTCLENAEGSFDALLAGFEGANTKYDGTRADACVAAYARSASKCGKPTDADSVELVSACSGLYQGTLDAGETCSSSAECAGKLSICKKEDPADQTGKCAPLEKRAHARRGDDCATSCVDSICSYDPADDEAVTAACYASDKLWCNEGTCEALGDVGDACDVFGCKAGLFCAGGACAALRKAGQPCDGPEACARGTFCNGSECENFHANGAACDFDSECESGACRNDVCAINNATEQLCSGLSLDVE